MNERTRAEEHLRVIRSLMERATIYRAISAPTALVGGLLGGRDRRGDLVRRSFPFRRGIAGSTDGASPKSGSPSWPLSWRSTHFSLGARRKKTGAPFSHPAPGWPCARSRPACSFRPRPRSGFSKCGADRPGDPGRGLDRVLRARLARDGSVCAALACLPGLGVSRNRPNDSFLAKVARG